MPLKTRQAAPSAHKEWLRRWLLFGGFLVLVPVLTWIGEGHAPPGGEAAASLMQAILAGALFAWLSPLGSAARGICLVTWLGAALLCIKLFFPSDRAQTVSPAADAVATVGSIVLPQLIATGAGLLWLAYRRRAGKGTS